MGGAKGPRSGPREATDVRTGARRRGRPGPLDIELGARIRRLRLERGWSQAALSEAVEVSPQQLSKYEAGADRMSATILVRSLAVLGFSFADVFTAREGPEGLELSVNRIPNATAQTDKLVDDFLTIRDRRVREDLSQLIAGLARAMRAGSDRSG